MRIWGAVATVLVTLCGSVAQAGETFPSEVRTIAATTATSPCIGDPKTPVCAAETFLACDSRQDKSLCRRVGVERTEFQLPPYDLRYRILFVHILTPKDIPPEFRDAPWMKPGYAEIALMEMANPILGIPKNEYRYIARPNGSQWEIVSWLLWKDDD